MNPFETQAEPKARRILRNYPYCLVTPLECIDYEWGTTKEGESVKCTDLEIIRNMYYDNYDILIETPDRCNY